jgi:hypothetical protein
MSGAASPVERIQYEELVASRTRMMRRTPVRASAASGWRRRYA